MKIKFLNTRETVSEYLTLLTEEVDKGKKKHLHDMAELLTHKGIEPLAPKKNTPYLYKSGEKESRWVYDLWDKNKATVSITYSGMTYKEDGYSNKLKTWLEFSEEAKYAQEALERGDYSEYTYYRYHMSATSRTLSRDYAFFQETGIDELADSDDAKHKYFIERGIDNRHKTILNKSAGYLKQIIRNM